MAQRGKKKPSTGSRPRRKAGEGRAPSAGSESSDWTASETGPSVPESDISNISDRETGTAGESDLILDADPALESEDRAHEFTPRENPFEAGLERPPTENPVPMPPPEDAEMDVDEFSRRKTQPPLGDEDSGLEENLRMDGGIVHLVDREDMGKGVQPDPEAYAADTEDVFLDASARAGAGRASAEDVLKHRGMAAPTEGRERDAGKPEGAGSEPGYLDNLLGDLPFPASKETVACRLALDAYANGGPAEAFHDLVIQLDQGRFLDLNELKRAIGDWFAWENAHGRPGGGKHGR
jgi:hypothetical protein